MKRVIPVTVLAATLLLLPATGPVLRGAEAEPPAAEADDGFGCLARAAEVERVTGTFEQKAVFKAGKGKGFDARGAVFTIKDAKWGMVDVVGTADDTGMCWAGGFFASDKPWDASWSDHKDVQADGGGKTRNSAVISLRAPGATVSGIHFFNVHDGPRTTDSPDWRVEHVWGEYVRDDAIENDHQYSGVLYDSLLDGCFVGISTRSTNPAPTAAESVVVLDRVLLRLTPQPYGYKWQERGSNYLEGDVPMGQGMIFKVNDPAHTPRFIIKNSIFCLHYDRTGNGGLIDFPRSIIQEASNNTIVWLGEGEFGGEYDPAGFEVTKDVEVWKRAVRDWHARHPEVGKDRKPAEEAMGDTTILRKF